MGDRHDPHSMAVGGAGLAGAGVSGRAVAGSAGPRLAEVRRSGAGAGWAEREYIDRKRIWLAAHPNAGHEEITRAYRRFAKELGL